MIVTVPSASILLAGWVLIIHSNPLPVTWKQKAYSLQSIDQGRAQHRCVTSVAGKGKRSPGAVIATRDVAEIISLNSLISCVSTFPSFLLQSESTLFSICTDKRASTLC